MLSTPSGSSHKVHAEAHAWVAAHAIAGRVLDIGGRDVNGTVRNRFGPDYTSIDLIAEAGVDIVADVTTFEPADKFDVIVCCEVLEHTADDIIGAAHRLLHPGGLLILTAAGPDREPHSAVDGGPLRDGEYYANVTEPDLERMLKGWGDVTIDCTGVDIRAVATR